ncbi:hypothetical protein [Methylorubrum salsuginis]|uniref:Uncharacterized protein n=1 Tax=Methylorubrum salsuginis TaxID=414703 RepID=A0A1I4FJH4_9HYPH|nr:hypothetical protein [Methylorubrum salsuginis]SFL18085.1 hypothetical protein SAMN04488125_11074 [Methylorubrum salsuginis]
MTSALTVELASDGLVWRNATGLVVASITAVAGIDEVAAVMRGFPPEVWSIEATQHLSAVLSEVARNAGIAARFDDVEPLVPRRAPAPADAVAPWG